jgi:hypothetical protein
LLSSPSGSSCREALLKLGKKFDTTDLYIVDIENILCNDWRSKEKLKQAGVTTDSPSILDITWNLSRTTISQLWQNAARQCMSGIAASPAKIRIVCCNLLYYGGRREEFYSTVNPQEFSTNDGQSPSLVCVFIDDVYDMYIRLTRDNEIYELKPYIIQYYRRLQTEEGISVKEMKPQESSIYFLEAQLELMTRLLNWRNQEIIMAENLAFQFQAKFMAWGVKQLAEVISSWISQSDSTTVYLSHPISRLRDKRRTEGNWPDVVSHFNSLPKTFFERGLLCVMPTAIDELRISRVENKRHQLLEERWPLPDGNGNSVLYQLPEGTTDIHHTQLIAPRYWDFDKQEASLTDKNNIDDQSNTLLRVFEREIERQTSSRDHLLVSHANGLLVFRPFIWVGSFSSGVEAEIRHWEYLAKTDNNKRAAFIHFEEDIGIWFSIHKESIDSEINSWKERLLAGNYHISAAKAREVIEWIIQNKGGILDNAPLPAHKMQQITINFPDIVKEAKINYLRTTLTGVGDVASSQVGLWICENMEELQANYNEIGEFLKSGILPSERWHSKINKILPDNT